MLVRSLFFMYTLGDEISSYALAPDGDEDTFSDHHTLRTVAKTVLGEDLIDMDFFKDSLYDNKLMLRIVVKKGTSTRKRFELRALWGFMQLHHLH